MAKQPSEVLVLTAKQQKAVEKLRKLYVRRGEMRAELARLRAQSAKVVSESDLTGAISHFRDAACW